MTDNRVMHFRDVCRQFTTPAGTVHVLKNIDLEINSGDFLIVTGPSGSGKSTFLHLCALIDQPSSGTVHLSGRDISHISEKDLCNIRKMDIGIVFQRFCLLPHRTARDNVLFRFRYVDDPPADLQSLTARAMQQMGIAEVAERQARLLSSGEQQRVAIARAVVQKPLILLADEPTGNLDSDSALAVMQCFKELNNQGLTLVVVTHNESLLSYASRHLVCRNGALSEVPLQ